MVVDARPQWEPDPWIEFHADRIHSGPILDLACGSGRHGRLFLQRNMTVHFLDRDLSGVEDLLDSPRAHFHHFDLENGNPWPFQANEFQAIIVVNYLYRPLWKQLSRSIKPGGILLYKTFAQGNEQLGRPRNPDYLLRKNELIEVFGNVMDVIDCRQQKEESPERITQHLCAVKSARKD